MKSKIHQFKQVAILFTALFIAFAPNNFTFAASKAHVQKVKKVKKSYEDFMSSE